MNLEVLEKIIDAIDTKGVFDDFDVLPTGTIVPLPSGRFIEIKGPETVPMVYDSMNEYRLENGVIAFVTDDMLSLIQSDHLVITSFPDEDGIEQVFTGKDLEDCRQQFDNQVSSMKGDKQ